MAKRAAAWGELSDYRLEQAIAFWVDRHDPDALRRIGVSARCRDLYVGKNSDQSDTTAVWGRLYATDAAALHAPPDPQISGEDSPPLDPPARERVKPSAGLLMGGGIVPAPLLAELIRCAATVSHVHPGGDTRESGYVPSAKLAEFVRVRDLTFRFPVAR